MPLFTNGEYLPEEPAAPETDPLFDFLEDYFDGVAEAEWKNSHAWPEDKK